MAVAAVFVSVVAAVRNAAAPVLWSVVKDCGVAWK